MLTLRVVVTPSWTGNVVNSVLAGCILKTVRSILSKSNPYSLMDQLSFPVIKTLQLEHR